MPYFYIRGGGTSVEAIGLAATPKGIHYANFAGPAEAAKAIWAAAVGSKKTGFMNSSWRSDSLLKPNARAVVRLPNTNYVNYILRVTNPNFILITDARMSQLGQYPSINPYGTDEQEAAYHAVKRLFPEWEYPHHNSSYHSTLQASQIGDWYAEQPHVQAELARKLVNALNQFTRVPVLPEWGPSLLARLPYDARDYVSCYGDAVTGLYLHETFAWADWIGQLLRNGAISIPDPKGA